MCGCLEMAQEYSQPGGGDEGFSKRAGHGVGQLNFAGIKVSEEGLERQGNAAEPVCRNRKSEPTGYHEQCAGYIEVFRSFHGDGAEPEQDVEEKERAEPAKGAFVYVNGSDGW